MKFNWGHGIAIFFISFVCILVFFVIKTTQHDHSLVSDNYYKDDLNYQQIIEKKKNVISLGDAFKVSTNDMLGQVEIYFPNNIAELNGQIKFMKPENSLSDIILKLSPSNDSINNRYVIPFEKLAKRGKWKILLEWDDNKNNSYYHQQHIVIE